VSTPRDHLTALRWRAANGRTRVSNAWYRLAGRRVSGARTRVSNWRNRRTLERGRRDLPARAADGLRSSLPVYRNRTDRRTGRPNRDAREIGKRNGESLARMRAGRPAHGRTGALERELDHLRAARPGYGDRPAGRVPVQAPARVPAREAWEDAPDASRSRGVPDPLAVRTLPPRAARSPL
jgi:hypothetical protein